MSGDSPTYGQEQSARYTAQAGQIAHNATSQYLNSPFYQGILPLTQRIIQNPDVYSRQDIDRVEANSAAQGIGAYNAQLSRTNERAASTGSYRSGSARLGERLAAADLGAGIASGNREIETTALAANRASNLAAIDLGNRIANIPYGLTMNEANILTGAAGNNVWQAQAQDPFAAAFQTLGGIAGQAAGAPAGGGLSSGSS